MTLEPGDVVVIRANFRGRDDPQHTYLVQEVRGDDMTVIVPLVGATQFIVTSTASLQKIP